MQLCESEDKNVNQSWFVNSSELCFSVFKAVSNHITT